MRIWNFFMTNPILAEAGKGVEFFPLKYQVACIILTALFLFSFSVTRDPRGWRRLYQTKFGEKDTISVNKNKKIDESIKTYGIYIAMAFLLADVSCFVVGVTHRYRNSDRQLTKEEQFRIMDVQRMNSNGSKDSSRRAVAP